MMEPNRENPVGENCEAADRMGAFDRVPDRHSPGDDGQAASGSERSVSLKYHERPDRISITGTFLNSLKLHVPEDWTITLGVWWTNVIPKNRADLPKQGFKIHVSAIPENAEEILKASLGVLLRREVQFKVLTGPEILLEALSKNHDRGASGKFMTIYPADDDQFRSLLRELHEATREFSGPYILSDMQYGDNGVLYYRYGSFVPRYWILPGGSRQYLIESPAGELVPDERNPFYSLPEWVEEPFDGCRNIAEAGVPLLGGRFEVKTPLKFSNSGGVYVADDTHAGGTAIIKEARPHVGRLKASNAAQVDCVDLIKREHAILCHTASTAVAPEALALFEQDGHWYLAQERIAGTPLQTFRARDDFMLSEPYDSAKTARFTRRLSSLSLEAITAIERLHRHGVFVCDLSPANIMIDMHEEERFTVRIIDFETGWLRDWGAPDAISVLWGTSGFKHPEKDHAEPCVERLPLYDWYALGMSLYSALMPNNEIFALDPGKIELMIERHIGIYGMPESFGEAILDLLRGRVSEARARLARLCEQHEAELPRYAKPLSGASFHTEISAQSSQACSGIATFLINSYTDARTDRLWPSGPEIFVTNPLALLYGAGGVIAFLVDCGQELPTPVCDWWARRVRVLGNCPPGYLSGLAGIAYVSNMMGQPEKARELMAEAADSKSFGTEMSWAYGSAGIGHAALYLHAQTGDDFYLDLAREAAQVLVQSSKCDETGRYWPTERLPGGAAGWFGGSSGVAVFLAQFSSVAADASARKASMEAIDHAINAAGWSNDKPVWYPSSRRMIHSPYLHSGAAGVCSSLCRVYANTGYERALEWALLAADTCYARTCVSCDQMLGISGIGEAMLDCFQVTGKEEYLDRACRIAQTVFSHLIETDAGIAVPGPRNMRIQNDYAGGAAGVGSYLLRLSAQAPRRFMDLNARTSRESR